MTSMTHNCSALIAIFGSSLPTVCKLDHSSVSHGASGSKVCLDWYPGLHWGSSWVTGLFMLKETGLVNKYDPKELLCYTRYQNISLLLF